MEATVFSDYDYFLAQKARLIKGGKNHLQIISDFDRTLTTSFINGRKAPSLISALRDGHYLSADYSVKAQALFDHYHPLEMDVSLDLENKKALMSEWYKRHFDLLIESGLTQETMALAIDNQMANLRPLVPEFIEMLKNHNIPLIIYSATGLGTSALKYFFTKRGLMSDNIIFLANDFIWAPGGEATGVKEPIIHSFNKDEILLKLFNLNKDIQKRSNIIIFGDTIGDASMANNYAAQVLLKIGFLNDKIRESLDVYKEHYDALVLNDGDFNLPFLVLQEIINSTNI